MAQSDEIDITRLTEEQIASADKEALRRALRSIMRGRGPQAMHKNHNSHSNEQVLAIPEARPAARPTDSLVAPSEEPPTDPGSES